MARRREKLVRISGRQRSVTDGLLFTFVAPVLSGRCGSLHGRESCQAERREPVNGKQWKHSYRQARERVPLLYNGWNKTESKKVNQAAAEERNCLGRTLRFLDFGNMPNFPASARCSRHGHVAVLDSSDHKLAKLSVVPGCSPVPNLSLPQELHQ